MLRVKSKILSMLVMSAIIITSLSTGAVFAAKSDEKAMLGLEVLSNEVVVGKAFPLNLTIDFDESVGNEGGVMVFSCDLKFNPDYLEIVDPKTMQPIVFDENGELAEGSTYYIFGDLGTESSFSLSVNEDGNSLRLTYGGRSSDSDIIATGPLVRFAFRPNESLEVNGSVSTKISVENPSVIASKVKTNEDGSTASYDYAELDASGESMNFSIVPPYVMPKFGSQFQNSTFNVSGRSQIDTSLGEPLMAVITNSAGETVTEQEAKLSSAKYSLSFELDEDTFPTGRYKLTLTYGLTSLSREFDIIRQDDPTPPDPVPEEPEPEPEEPEKPSDGGNGSTGGGGSSSGGSSSGGSGGGSGSSISLSDKPTTVTKPDEPVQTPEKPEKPAVTYPSDIAEHWAKTNIEYVYDHALMNGYEDGTFGPQNNITRAEFATVMSRFLKLADNPGAAEKFADANQHWAKSYIGALVDAGIVNGTDEASFSPDNNITRQEIATILARAFELSEQAEDTFADDAQISDWARAYIYSVRKAGYMQGDEYNNFAPIANATRAEVATIIYRLHSAK